MSADLASVREAIASGDARRARASIEAARAAYHRGVGESPYLLESAVSALEDAAWASRPTTTTQPRSRGRRLGP